MKLLVFPVAILIRLQNQQTVNRLLFRFPVQSALPCTLLKWIRSPNPPLSPELSPPGMIAAETCTPLLQEMRLFPSAGAVIA